MAVEGIRDMNGWNKAVLDKLKKQLSEIPQTLIGEEECRKAGICMPLVQGEDGWEMLFEVRSSRLKAQPGDICFPGGMLEEYESPLQGACRELREELLIGEADFEVLGSGKLLHTGSGMLLYPFAVLLKDYKGTFSPAEVDRVFTVPVSFFLENEPEVYEIALEVRTPDDFPYEKISGGKNYSWRKRREKVYFYQYGEYSIWGITARLIYASGILECLRELE